MDGYAERFHDVRIGQRNHELEGEFEAALGESSTLSFRVAYSVLRHRQDAEDVAQEALVKAHRSFRQLRDRQRFRAWLVRITWRLAIDRRRSDLRRTAREITHAREQPAATAPDESAAEERAAALWRAIDDLPEKLRVVIVLANMQEHDIAEVARLLGLPPGTVKSRLFLARTRLKEKLSCVLDPTNPTR
jgi:RNA polymerase sigma-70 factor (ECF subfamily)